MKTQLRQRASSSEAPSSGRVRRLLLTTLTAATIGLASAIGGASETVPNTVNAQAPYPAAVSLVQESGGYTSRQSGTSAPLYLNEKDSPDKSVCAAACETQWYPLLAEEKDK